MGRSCYEIVCTESGSVTHILQCDVHIPTKVFVLACKRGGVDFIEGLFGNYRSYAQGAWRAPGDIDKFRERLRCFVDGFDWNSLGEAAEIPSERA